MRFLTFCGLAMALISPARATTVRPLDLAERHRAAKLVVHAEVQSVEARRSADRRRIESTITLTPQAIFKGEHSGPLEVRRAGGELDGLRTWADGLYDYRPGEDVLLFLVPYEDTWVSVGVGVGTLPVRERSGRFEFWYDGTWRVLERGALGAGDEGGGVDSRRPAAPAATPTGRPAPGR